ncbi:MAG: tRNA guanosine(34) transglycosylase Tgt [Deltaproteobacteria bacterium]|nr:tRNA guanosine(34) transglycosylase Tgt [Deltaproteobacteria bacterium]
MQRLSFTVSHTATGSHARRGRMMLRHGPVETPVFMPVGTQGSVKALSSEDVAHELDAQIILGNTYHLYLRPGPERMQRLGGLHKFMRWDRNILTDSGGFQVFSLGQGTADRKPLLEKLTEEGAFFRSHIDGSRHTLTPETSIAMQEAIGSDIMMVLDECPPSTAPREYQAQSMDRTTRWAERCLGARTDAGGALFGIFQGGLDLELRQKHLAALSALPFEGLAIGGLAVGETKEDFLRTLRHVAPMMPADRPRYLMGVGTPEDLVEGVHAGVDMFDCVMPTRNARNGTLFVNGGKIVIKNQAYTDDEGPIDPSCRCSTCRTYSRAYLRHLFIAEELSFHRFATLHNLTHYLDLMRQMRTAIEAGSFTAWRDAFYAGRAAASSTK